MGAGGAEVDIDGRRIRLTNLGKMMYPRAGFTKAHVIDYYRRIAPVLLPHLEGRALTLKRYPDGVEGPFFYEKTCPTYRPEWVRTATVPSSSRGEGIEFCVVDSLPSLMWAANLADLEMHTYLARAAAPQEPTQVVFDLDPGPGVGLLECAEVALRLQDILADLGLDTFVKTSGGKGIQAHVPLNTPATYADTKPFAHAVAMLLERQSPDAITSNMAKRERPGRVFIDWSQNDAHKTTVCAYSLRANERPTVATPLLWGELQEALAARDASRLRFSPEEVLARVEAEGDLLEPVLRLRQALPKLG